MYRYKEQPQPLRQITPKRDNLLRACCRGCDHISLGGREIAEIPRRQKSLWGAGQAIHEKGTDSLASLCYKASQERCRGSWELLATVQYSSQTLKRSHTADAGETVHCRSWHWRNCLFRGLAKGVHLWTHRQTPSSSSILLAPSPEETEHYAHWQNEKYFKGLVLFCWGGNAGWTWRRDTKLITGASR